MKGGGETDAIREERQGASDVSGTSFPGLSGGDAGVLTEGAPHRVHGVAHIAPIREILR